MQDHLKLVSRGGATGRFKSGLSVPKARPTMFWEAQQVELKFDNAKYESTKDEREQKHNKKKQFMLQKQAKALGEVKTLMDELQ